MEQDRRRKQRPYPSDAGFIHRIGIGSSVGYGRCVRPLDFLVLIYFYCDKFEGTYWTHSRSLFLEWNEEDGGIFGILEA